MELMSLQSSTFDDNRKMCSDVKMRCGSPCSIATSKMNQSMASLVTVSVGDVILAGETEVLN